MANVATKSNKSKGMKMDPEKATCFADYLAAYIGQKVAVLCARYQYRGILAAALTDCVIIADSTSVEISGPSNELMPNTEDAINGSVCIKYDAIEIVYQPNWSNSPLPGEK